MRLEPLHLWCVLGPGPLRPQVLAALAPHGEALRWAITAVEPASTLEAVAERRVRVEAVMLR